MSTTSDRNDPGINKKRETDGQNEAYLVLSDEERALGFVRPVRTSYKHVGVQVTGETRELTGEEKERFKGSGYVLFEKYPPDRAPVEGRYLTARQVRGGCGRVTTMGRKIAETYARDPSFYGSTFCVECDEHLPVAEFVWSGTDDRVGS